MTLESPTNILLVEDNKIDARLMRLAIERTAGWSASVVVVEDGEKALKLLGGENGDHETGRPDLVILDLNLPKRDGKEVLRFIRLNEHLQKLMVFVFSSSPLDVAREVMREAEVEADAYLEKPFMVDTYLAIGERIKESYQNAAVLRTGA